MNEKADLKTIITHIVHDISMSRWQIHGMSSGLMIIQCTCHSHETLETRLLSTRSPWGSHAYLSLVSTGEFKLYESFHDAISSTSDAVSISAQG